MRGLIRRLLGIDLDGPQNTSQKATVNASDNAQVNIDQRTIIIGDQETLETAKGLIARPDLPAIGTQLSESSDNLDVLKQENPERHGLIDHYRDLSNDGQVNTAIRLLQALLQNVENLEPSVRLRAHLNLGLAFERAGNRQAAIVELVEASKHCPSHPKSRTAKALALLHDAQNQDAFDEARAILFDDSTEGLAAICLCYAASRLPNQELDEDILEGCIDQESVRIAYLDYYAKRNRDEWLSKAQDAIRDFPGSKAIKAEYALALLPYGNKITGFLLGEKGDEVVEAQILDCAEILKEAAELSLRRDPPNPSSYEPMVNNAVIALRLSGKEKECVELLERAMSVAGEPSQYLLEQIAVTYVRQNRQQDAINTLSQHKLDARLKVMLSSLQAELGEFEQSRENLQRVLKDDLEAEVRLNALRALFEIALNAGSAEDARTALDDLQAELQGSAEALICENIYRQAFPEIDNDRVAETENQDTARLDDLAKLAENLDDLSYVELLQLARQYAKAKEFRKASDLLHGRTSLNRLSDGLRTYLGATIDGQMLERAIEAIKALPEEVKSSNFALEIAAVAYFNAGEVQKSIRALRTLYERNPESIQHIINYANALIRDGREDQVRRFVESIDEDKAEGHIRGKKLLALLLAHAGEIARAQKYAHTLYLRNRDQLEAWQAVFGTVIPVGDITSRYQSVSLEPQVVAEHCFVEARDSDGQTHSFVIEPDSELRSLQDGALAPEHAISQALIGKRVGDQLSIPLARGQQTFVSISVIKHKYVAAFHKILANIESRFGNASGIFSVKVNVEDKEHGLDEIRAQAKARHDFIQGRVDQYAKHPIPLTVLAKQVGIDPIDAGIGLYRECRQKIITCSGNLDELDFAKNCVGNARGNGCLLDPLSAWIAYSLGIGELLKTLFGTIFFTQQTQDLLIVREREARALCNSICRGDGQGHAGTMGYADGHLRFTEATPEAQREIVRTAKNFSRWLEQNCSRASSIPYDDMPDVLRLIEELDGGHINADIMGAHRSDCLLISEDLRIRALAKEIYNVPGTWLQAVLLYAFEHRLIEAESYTRYVANLSQIGEDYLSVNAECIAMAIQMEQANASNAWIADAILGCLGGKKAEPSSHARVAYLAIREICRSHQPSANEVRAVSRIFEAVVRERADATIIMDALQQAFEQRGPGTLIRHTVAWRKGHFI